MAKANRTTAKNSNYIGLDLESMEEAKNYYNWLIKKFGKYMGDNVGEVGAGSGTFCKYLLEKAPKSLTAIEPSTEMFKALQENLSKYPNVKTINSFLGDPSYLKLDKKLDSLFYINVLEHVQKDHKEVAHAGKLLKDGGNLCIYVPALNWLMGKFDQKVGHYRRYNKKTLRNLIEKNGFKTKELHYSDPIGILPWLISFKLLRKEDLAPSQVKLYDRLVIPVLRRLESLVKPPIGKNLFAVATKV